MNILANVSSKVVNILQTRGLLTLAESARIAAIVPDYGRYQTSRHFSRMTRPFSTNPVDNQNEENTQASEISPEQKELDELKDHITIIDNKYKRVLADMENLRQRTAREIEETKKYAILKFCKDLIEIPDTMSLALQTMKPEEVGRENYKGVSMINDRAIDIFRRHGLLSINPQGEKFDPNMHQAMFEIPDASKEPGTVGEVVKIGWQLHDRVVRPALVGVVKKPQ